MVAKTESPGDIRTVPRHVAIIMDGNGRWAKRRALPRQAGHHAGIKPVRMAVEHCASNGIGTLTVFAFSSENWHRPADEVRGLMGLFLDALDREVGELDSNGVRLSFIGDRDVLNTDLRDATYEAERQTAENTKLELVVAVAYGGRWDLTQAARRLAVKACLGEIDAGAITEAMFAAELETAGRPGVDLLIRTGGEKRISNFLLWDIAYSEVFFSDVLWPDFTVAEFDRALDFYAQRQRRFGKTGEQVEAISC